MLRSSRRKISVIQMPDCVFAGAAGAFVGVGVGVNVGMGVNVGAEL